MRIFVITAQVLSLVYRVSDKPTTQLPAGYTQKLSSLRTSVSPEYQLYSTHEDLEADHFLHYDDFQNLNYIQTDHVFSTQVERNNG
jgi:hypothetical protein